ncbi:MAG: GtrA family protein, partial [Paludibacteraceae bacterium]|nr:GtrA family protein [Paludibacteraceae bacterium]
QKYVTFSASYLRGHVQLRRYLLVVMINLGLNYVGLKLFVELAHFYPTPSKMLITIITTLFSYFAQKKFTFKTASLPLNKESNI